MLSYSGSSDCNRFWYKSQEHDRTIEKKGEEKNGQLIFLQRDRSSGVVLFFYFCFCFLQFSLVVNSHDHKNDDTRVCAYKTL